MNKDKVVTMSAAVLFENNQNLKIIKNIEIPELTKGQVLVEIHYAGICQSQLMEIKGHRGKDKYLPHMLGHEGCGKILKIGKDVRKVKKGDFVIIGWIKGVGLDVLGARYKVKDYYINSGPVTTFSTHSIISENRLLLMPKNVNKKYASLYGCAIPTGIGMIINQTTKRKNKNIGIIGLGGIGIFSLIAAKYCEFKNIIVIDNDKKKLELARNLGADITIDANKKNIKKEIYRLLKNKNLDYCIDTAGKTETIEKSFELISDNGCSIFCSHPQINKKIKIDPFELIKGKNIIGSWGGNTNPDKDIKKYVKILSNKTKDLKNIFYKEYSLAEINKAIKNMKMGKVLRPIIKIK